MKTFAFYSYKGGVGRSTLLCNVARILAEQGLNVACVDCDIESTGLQAILRKRALGVSSVSLQDVLSESDPDSLARKLKAVVSSIPVKGNGNLLLVPAAIDHAKTRSVNQAMAIHRQRVFDNLHTLFKFLEEVHSVDVLFCDARAGISDMAEPALVHADGVVMTFRLGIQQQIGLSALLHFLLFYYDELSLHETNLLLQPSNIPRDRAATEDISSFIEELFEIVNDTRTATDVPDSAFPIHVLQPVWANSDLQNFGSKVLSNGQTDQNDESIRAYAELASKITSLL